MIIEHKNKTYNLINTLKFEEVDAIYKHTRKYIEITEQMNESLEPIANNQLYTQHVKALDDEHEMIRISLKRCLGLGDKEIKNMDYGEVKYLFNKVVEMTLILAKE